MIVENIRTMKKVVGAEVFFPITDTSKNSHVCRQMLCCINLQ